LVKPRCNSLSRPGEYRSAGVRIADFLQAAGHGVDMCAERRPDRDRKMPEASDPDNRGALAGPQSCLAEGGESGQTRTEERCGLGEFQSVGQCDDMLGRRDHVFGISAVLSYPRKGGEPPHTWLWIFVNASRAGAAGERRMHAHPRPGLHGRHTVTARGDHNDRLVTRNPRHGGGEPFTNFDVGETHPASGNAHEDLTRSRPGHGDLAYLHRFAESFEDCCAHVVSPVGHL
jgi:hypothetical protein